MAREPVAGELLVGEQTARDGRSADRVRGDSDFRLRYMHLHYSELLLMRPFALLVMFHFFLCLVLPVASSTTVADETAWRVGLGRVEITPETPIRMAGYASRTRPFESIATKLFAKAILIEDSNGHRGLLITTDLLGMPAEMTDSMSVLIQAETGLSRDQIVFSSSHTHSGPALLFDDNRPDWEHADIQNSLDYTRRLSTKLVELAIGTCNETEEARISIGQGVAEFVMNRRESTERGIVLGVNPRGHVDRSVPVMKIESLDGEVIAILFGAACHLTTSGSRTLQLSGDFGGYAQQQLERDFPSAQAMFVQGCGGDANPYPLGEESLARLHGQALAASVIEAMQGDLSELTGQLETRYERIALPLQQTLSSEQLEALQSSGSWRSWVAEQMKNVIEEQGSLPRTYAAPIAVWQIGEEFTFVALSGEVVVGYLPLIEAAIGARNLWVSAYCNDVFGYLPTSETLRGGGYETRGLYSGGIGFFSPEVETVVIDAITRLAVSAGRNNPTGSIGND